MPSAVAVSTASSPRRSKKGVPSRDKLAKALGKISSQASAVDGQSKASTRKTSSSPSKKQQNRPARLDVAKLQAATFGRDVTAVRSPLQKVVSPMSDTKPPQSPSFISTFFSSRVASISTPTATATATTNQQENVPSPRQKSKKSQQHQQQFSIARTPSSNSFSSKKSKPVATAVPGGYTNHAVSPRRAAAFAIRKSKAAVSAALLAVNNDRGDPPTTPRQQAVAVLSAEQRKMRSSSPRKQQQQQPRSSSKATGVSTTIRVTGVYTQDDVNEALKISTDIERDIQATNQTLAKISEFIDKSITSPRSNRTAKSSTSSRATTKSRSVATYSATANDIDTTIIDVVDVVELKKAQQQQQQQQHEAEACVAIQDESSISVVEDRQPSAGTRGGGTAIMEGHAATRQGVSSLKSSKSSSKERQQRQQRQPAYNTDYKKHVTTTSKQPHYKVMDVNDHHTLPVEATRDNHALAPQQQQHPQKATVSTNQSPAANNKGGLDHLLHMASMGNFHGLVPSQDDNDDDDNRKDIASPMATATVTNYSVRSSDPPDRSLAPSTMGSMDELQEHNKALEFIDSQDDSDDDGDLSSTNPDILSQISAFIDKVEKKNSSSNSYTSSSIADKKKTKKKSSKAAATKKHKKKEKKERETPDDFMATLDLTKEDIIAPVDFMSTLDLTSNFDIDTLTKMFDEPISPTKKRRAAAVAKQEQAEKDEKQAEEEAAAQKKVEEEAEKERANTTASFFTVEDAASTEDLSISPPLQTISTHEDLPSLCSSSNGDMTKSHESSTLVEVVVGLSGDANRNEVPPVKKTSSAKVSDPVCQLRGDDLSPQSHATKHHSSKKFRNKADPEQCSTEKPSPSTRGFDPPAETKATESARARADPPEETISAKDAEPTLAGETKKADPDPTSTTSAGRAQRVDPDSMTTIQLEIPLETPLEDTKHTLPAFSPKIRSRPPKPEEEIATPRAGSINRMKFNEPGDETAPFIVEDPDEPLIVDLTQVASEEVYGSSAGVVSMEPQVKLNPEETEEAEVDIMDHIAALETLLSIESISKATSPKTGKVVLENIFSADTKDGAGAGFEMQPVLSPTSVSKNTAGFVSEANGGDCFERVLSSEENPLLCHLKRTEGVEDHQDRLQPPGTYSCSSESDNDTEDKNENEKVIEIETDSNLSLNGKAEGLQGLVDSMAVMTAVQESNDPLQSLMIASRNDLAEESGLKQNAGGLDFVDISHQFAGNDEVSNEQIRELQGLVSGKNTIETEAQATDHSQSTIQRQTADASKVTSDASVLPTTTYSFEPSQKPPMFDGSAYPGQSANPFLRSRDQDSKGMKRKFSTKNTSNSNGSLLPDTSNWLASLDSIFTGKKDDEAKDCNDIANNMDGSDLLQEGASEQSIASAISSKQTENELKQEMATTIKVLVPLSYDLPDEIEAVSAPVHELQIDEKPLINVVNSPEKEEQNNIVIMEAEEEEEIIFYVSSSEEGSIDNKSESFDKEAQVIAEHSVPTVNEVESVSKISEPEAALEDTEATRKAHNPITEECDSRSGNVHQQTPTVHKETDSRRVFPEEALEEGRKVQTTMSPPSTEEEDNRTPMAEASESRSQVDMKNRTQEGGNDGAKETTNTPTNDALEDAVKPEFNPSEERAHDKEEEDVKAPVDQDSASLSNVEVQETTNTPSNVPFLKAVAQLAHNLDEKPTQAAEETTSPRQGSEWVTMVDLTHLDDEDEEENAKFVNAWETPLVDQVSDDSLTVLSWEHTQRQKQKPQVFASFNEEPLVLDTNTDAVSSDPKTPKDDQTPRMHQNKRFDFIEDVDESDNISAYFSRMVTLKKGGHLPGLDTKAVKSYEEKANAEDDADCVEVDIDVGFVKKSLAPSLSNVHNSWEDDQKDANRYVSIEEAADAGDNNRNLSSTARLRTKSHDSGTSNKQEDSSDQTPSTSSSKTSTLFEAKDESITGSVHIPLIAGSSSSGLSGILDEEFDADPAPMGMPHFRQSLSYESENDEWLRKHDLATRKTVKPTQSWLTRTASGLQSKLSFATVETAKAINGVAAAKKLSMRTIRSRTHGGQRRNPIPSTGAWKLSYKERTKDHQGYFDIDFFSLFDSSAVGPLQLHHLDAAPWEARDTRQHFLHDQSISLSRNWFGKAQRTRGNDRIKQPVAHPKSMEMPMENKPHPEEWSDELYKTWKKPENDDDHSESDGSSYSGSGSRSSRSGTEGSRTQHDSKIGNSHSHSTVHTGSEGTSSSYTGGSSRFSSDGEETYYDDDDTPQCGTLINVKPNIGERVTRIHPDYTSQLRRSRWRMKYFPKRTFPYAK